MGKEWMEVLTNINLFSGIEKNNVEELVNSIDFRISCYEKNEYIAREGDKINEIGIIISGEVAIIKENAEGKRVIIDVMTEGGVFGEVVVFSANKILPSTVFVQKKSVILFLSVQKIFYNGYGKSIFHEKFIINLLRNSSEKALLLNEKVEYLVIKSMRGKLCTYFYQQYKMNQSKDIIITMNRSDLADYLSVSRPSMSREMCRMRDEGIIDFNKEFIQILDIETLKKNIE